LLDQAANWGGFAPAALRIVGISQPEHEISDVCANRPEDRSVICVAEPGTSAADRARTPEDERSVDTNTNLPGTDTSGVRRALCPWGHVQEYSAHKASRAAAIASVAPAVTSISAAVLVESPKPALMLGDGGPEFGDPRARRVLVVAGLDGLDRNRGDRGGAVSQGSPGQG
jgi:hypothetical protein